jgi:hypothetical protein
VATIESIPWADIPRLTGMFGILYVTNWRTIEVLIGNRLLITLARYGKFGIHHITMEELLEANKYNLKLERPYKFVTYKAACIMCYGAGRVDWIQKTRFDPKAKLPMSKDCTDHYVRDKSVVTKLGAYLYGSVPKIPEGFEICPNCKGTGLNVNRDAVQYEN